MPNESMLQKVMVISQEPPEEIASFNSIRHLVIPMGANRVRDDLNPVYFLHRIDVKLFRVRNEKNETASGEPLQLFAQWEQTEKLTDAGSMAVAMATLSDSMLKALKEAENSGQ